MALDIVDSVERIFGYRFKDRELLATALTHPSYAAEHPQHQAYDRLEFLGDAVLGFIVSEMVFRRFKDEPEGDLTARKHSMVCGSALAAAGGNLGVAGLVRTGKGAEAAREAERPSVVENALEALVGAAYMDGGLSAARLVVERIVETLSAHQELVITDPKSELQQLTQAASKSLPVYRIVNVQGPPHSRTFTAEVLVGDAVAGVGTGPSKQAAEKAAARDALQAMGGRASEG